MDIDKIDKNKYSLTLLKYITNPTENKGNLFLNLAMVKDGLKGRYAKLIKNENFKYKIYRYKDNFLIHVAVPSEKYDLTYDVLLELIDFKEEENKPFDTKLIKNTNFRVYSNSPAFQFTYGYVFHKRGLLIPETESKFEKAIFSRQPYQRNYYQITNIEKSIFYAINIILDNMSTLGELSSQAVSLPFTFFSSIPTPTQKINEYNRVKKEFKENETKDKKKEVRKDVVNRALHNKSQTGDFGRIITGKDKISGSKSSSSSHRKSKIKGKSKIK